MAVRARALRLVRPVATPPAVMPRLRDLPNLRWAGEQLLRLVVAGVTVAWVASPLLTAIAR